MIDNGSDDGTAEHVRRHHPVVELIALPENRGAAARNAGIMRLETPYVAISDDDSWWAPGALRRAAGLFDSHPRLGLLAARVLVEPGGRVDPTCLAMRDSPLEREADVPGAPVLGFIACGAIVRRSAFRSVGGFSEEVTFGGEETMLAIDLAAAGWGVSYVDEVVAHHAPAARGDDAVSERRATEVRNALWTTWLRRPAPSAVRRTASLLAEAARGGELAAAGAALRELPALLRKRRPIPADLERKLAAVECANHAVSRGGAGRPRSGR